MVINDTIHEFSFRGYYGYNKDNTSYERYIDDRLKDRDCIEIDIHEFHDICFKTDMLNKKNIGWHNWEVKMRRPLITVIFS